MSPREEGPLSDPRAQQERIKSEKHIVDLNKEDLRMLGRDGRFRRWFGKHAMPLLMLDVRTNNGGDLQHFMGRRSLVLDILREFEEVDPNFYINVQQARAVIDAELKFIARQAAPAEDEE